MNYEEFCQRLGQPDYPDQETLEMFFDAQDSYHIRLLIGKMGSDGCIYPSLPERAKWVCDVIPLLESRGAKRGKDFIVLCGENPLGDVYTEIHIIGKYISQEDV